MTSEGESGTEEAGGRKRIISVCLSLGIIDIWGQTILCFRGLLCPVGRLALFLASLQ